MEENGSKHLLLQTDEVELPIDGSIRRKRRRRADYIAITINIFLCIISCTAAITCVVYCNWVVAESQRGKGDIDAHVDRNLKFPVHSELPSKKLLLKSKGTIQDRLTQDSVEEDASNTLLEPDLDFDDTDSSADISGEDDAFTDSTKETEFGEEIDEDQEYTFDDSYDLADYQDGIESISEDQDDYADDQLDSSSGDYSFDDEEINTFRLRRALPKTKGKKEEGDFKGKSKQRSKKPGRGKQCKGKDCRKGKRTRRPFIPLAAQYEATVSDEFIIENLPSYNKLRNTEDCKYIEKMQGDLCRNRLYTPNDPTAPLNIFHGTPGFSSKKSPLEHIGDSSSFSVKSNGVMLVFAQVSFSTNRPTNGVSIFQNRTIQEPKTSQKVEKVVQTLQCKQGIPEDDVFRENVNQSCSIVGLLTVEKGDKLAIYSNYKGSALDLSEGSTYFGAVQLTKG